MVWFLRRGRKTRTPPGRSRLVFQAVAFHNAHGGDCDGMFGGSVDEGLWRRIPGAATGFGGLNEREASRAQGPREEGLPTREQFDLENRRIWRLRDGDAAPKSAFHFELSASERARVGLANRAAQGKLSAAGGTAATVNRVPLQIEPVVGLSFAALSANIDGEDRRRRENRECFDVHTFSEVEWLS